MIGEYDRVKIIKTDETGVVVDIRETNGVYYLVERDADNALVDCAADELEKLEEV